MTCSVVSANPCCKKETGYATSVGIAEKRGAKQRQTDIHTNIHTYMLYVKHRKEKSRALTGQDPQDASPDMAVVKAELA